MNQTECKTCGRLKKVTRVVSMTLLVLFLGSYVYSYASIFSDVGMSVVATYIDTENENVMRAVEVITENCKYMDDSYFREDCLIVGTENWVLLNIGNDLHMTPPSLPQSPALTSELGEGNCVDKAIFTASILKALKVSKVFLVSQKQHMCVLVQSGKIGFKFLNCLPHADTLAVKRV